MANFKVFKSSAGSGKTFALVRNYLLLCLGTANSFVFRRILAITFTNKASQEMKSRILKELKEISAFKERQAETNQMLELLAKELHLERTEIVKRAKHLYPIILHHYGDFNVSTIDRFAHKIIRTFSRDMGLAHNFDLELQEKIMLSEVIELLLNDFGKEESLSHQIRTFLHYKMTDGKSWKLHQDLIEFSLYSLNEKSYPYLEAIRSASNNDFENLIKEISERNSAVESKLQNIGKLAWTLIEKNGISNHSFYRGKSGIGNYFFKLYKGDPNSMLPNNYVKTTLEEDKWTAAKTSKDQALAIDNIREELRILAERAIAFAEEQYPIYKANIVVLKRIYQLRLLQAIEQRLYRWKKKKNILNISDFNRLIAKVVIHEAVPYIYERIGEYFQHIMVDEFQDTSMLQFINLAPLIEEALSKGHLNLLVGDPKQAIYRFRGGEVEQFIQLPHAVGATEVYTWHQDRLQAMAPHYNEVVLNVNYRSDEHIVGFNNQFFDFVRDRLGANNAELNQIFESQQQIPNHANDEGFVNIQFTDTSGTEFRQVNVEWVYQSILNCLEDGYSLADVLVLSRNNKDLSEIAGYLKEKQIEVVSSDALKLTQSDTISFLMNVLSYVHRSDDLTSKQALLKFLSKHSPDLGQEDQLYRDYLIHGHPLSKMLFDNFNFDINFATSISLYELIEYGIRKFNLSDKIDQFVLKFQEIILNYTKTRGEGIGQFMEWWDTYAEEFSVPATEAQNAVTMMSVHKSKGLEYSVVIYPFANDSVISSGGGTDFLWVENRLEKNPKIKHLIVGFSKDLEASIYADVYEEEYKRKEVDMVNLAYVAFTRAKARLYILGKKINNGKSMSLNKLLMDFVNANNGDSDDLFCFGKKVQKKQTQKQSEDEDSKVLTYTTSSWRGKLRIAASGQNSANAIENNEQQSFGILVHEFLARLNNINEWQELLQRFDEEGIISTDDLKKLELLMKKLFRMEELHKFFDSKYRCKIEADIYDGEGNCLRPDRLVIFEDKIALLDYKTGEKSEKHVDQMRTYQSLVRQIHNKEVNAYLLYTSTSELFKVPLTQ
ncbi:MAG: hypothetical protein CMO34_03445 [Verrucomicrobia bacterium]|nr:hypothetical protein [Verrucomicrobiota bacterium]